jgi:5-methylcytosine-specific restriction enzyme subunit McrC
LDSCRPQPETGVFADGKLTVIRLEEERPLSIARSQLPESVAIELHALHGSRISIEFPNPVNRQCYVFRPTGWVGQIPLTGGYLVRIAPKVPIANLFRMLEYAYRIKSFHFLKGTVPVESLEDIFERLAALLANLVLDRARQGLHRSYVEEEDNLPYLRGRVQIGPSIAAAMKGSTLLPCEYAEHTADIEDNRVLAHTLNLLPRYTLQREDVRRRVSQAQRVLSGLTPGQITAESCINRFYDRLTEDYRPMHGLCRFFLENSGPGLRTGSHQLIPFLVHMPTLFESFVAEWLRAHLPEGLRLQKQIKAVLDEQRKLFFRIDLVLTSPNGDRVFGVLDTKYKRSLHPEESDIEQLTAYAVRMATKHAALVYPSAAMACKAVSVHNITIHILTYDLAADLDISGFSLLAEVTGHMT